MNSMRDVARTPCLDRQGWGRPRRKHGHATGSKRRENGGRTHSPHRPNLSIFAACTCTGGDPASTAKTSIDGLGQLDPMALRPAPLHTAAIRAEFGGICSCSGRRIRTADAFYLLR
ncbi:hypothetical protein Zmor_026440 [Zophobas morio]|uniref:Uncharacterized protein n=1 Tax=Zophobas morio TaxID=2755281 RepID=A0AA38HTJ6_9CUCU|nr:hypothetical protein Zmor_026440 [Zophobas morio]